MKIALATYENQMSSRIPNRFEDGNYLLVYETEDGTCKSFENPEFSRATGLDMTKRVIDEHCEAIISGSVDSLAFEALAAAQITRYDGSGFVAKDAIRFMEENKLGYFRVPRGGIWTPHTHEHTACGCGFPNGEDH